MENTSLVCLSCWDDVCDSGESDEEGVLEEGDSVVRDGEEDGGDLGHEEEEEDRVVHGGEEGGRDLFPEEVE